MSAPNTKSKLIYKVILLGNVGVGKTSMFKRLRDGSYEDEISSVGMDKHTKAFRMDNGKTVFLDIWDTAGMEGFRTVTKSYYYSAKVIIMVYDVTLCKSFYDLGLWMTDAHSYAPDAIPVLIGNKFDLEEQEDIDQKTVDAFAAANEIALHFRVSVKDNQGIQEAFEEIAKYLHCGGLELNERDSSRHSSILLHDTSQPKTKSFCTGSCSRP